MSVPHSAARGGDPGPTVLYLAADAFGHAVVERLAVHRPGEVLAVDGGTHPSLWPWADLVVLATGSERSRTVEALDVVSHRHGTPWLPVVARPTEVQVGPAVVPGVTPATGAPSGGAGSTGSPTPRARRSRRASPRRTPCCATTWPRPRPWPGASSRRSSRRPPTRRPPRAPCGS
ncbi:hypothetical protein [Nocardioides zeae]